MSALASIRSTLASAAVFVSSAIGGLAQPVQHADPVIVSESALAQPPGTSELRLATTTPTAAWTFDAIGDRTANLHLNSAGAMLFGAPISLRGLANTPYFSEPAVGVVFGDIPLGHAFTFPSGLFGFAAATVARGPQPTALGRGAEAGTIRFMPADSMGASTLELRAGFGSFGQRTAALEAKSPRHDRADAVAAIAFERRDGFVSNTQLGTDVDAVETASGHAQVRVRPGPRTELTFQLLAHQHRDGAQPLVPLGSDGRHVARSREGATESDFLGGAVKAVIDSAVGRVTATTSATGWTLAPYSNRLVLPPTLDSQLEQRQRIWTTEVSLGAATANEGTWEIGGLWSQTDTSGAVTRSIPSLFPIEDSRYGIDGARGAAFANAAWSLAPRLQLQAAVRLETTHKDFSRSQRLPVATQFTDSRRFTAVLPKLTLTHALSADTTISTSVGRGARPGGWSAYTDKPALAAFAQEKIDSFEGEVRTLLARRTVQVTVRAFAYAIRDYQIERSFTATDYLVVNAPRARSTGGELETAWRPVSACTVTATLGVTDITLRRFTDPFTAADHAGSRAPYAPSYDAHLGATYRFSAGWFVAASATAVGRTYFDEAETITTSAAPHRTLDATAGFEGKRWRVCVFGQNLTDATYATLVVPGVRHFVPGAPRRYGLEVTRSW